MDIVYSDYYQANIGEHLFPTKKYRLTREVLMIKGEFGVENFEDAPLATREELTRFHTPEYIEKLEKNSLSDEERDIMELPFNPEVYRWAVASAGGTMLAAKFAQRDGVSCHLGGGFHHSYPDHGEGLCVINDVGVAAQNLLAAGTVSRILILDLDLHQGNGTLAFFRNDPRVLCFSMHQASVYPIPKEPGGVNIDLPDHISDADYLDQLAAASYSIFDEFMPQIVFYVAGADPYIGDQLGRLDLTIAGLRARDERVFWDAVSRGIPIVSVAAGGYARRVEDLVTIHANTIRVAKDFADEIRRAQWKA